MKPSISINKRLLLPIGTFFLLLLLVIFLLFHQDERRFQKLTQHFFQEEMTANTLNMHYSLAYPENYGIHNYSPILPPYSTEGNIESKAYITELLMELDNISPQALSHEDEYAYILLKRYLTLCLNLCEYPYYEEPLSPSSGMQSQLPILLAEYTFRSRQDVEDYLALLDQIDEYFASLLSFEQEKAAAGLLMPACSMEKVIEQCDTIVSEDSLANGTHFLQSTFAERIELLLQKQLISAEDAMNYQRTNDRLLRTVVQPAYEALGDGLYVLLDSSIPLTGLAAKPQGAEYYKLLLISETGSYREIAEIKSLLLTKLQEEYDSLLSYSRLYYEQNYSADDAFPYVSSEEMLHDLQNRMLSDFPALDNQDTKLPSVSVKEVSKSLQEYCAPAFYLTAPIDDTDSNVIYINPDNEDFGLDLYTTLAHEGYPGHLYQTVYSNRYCATNDINNVRQLLWYGGYMEGWALYVEFQSFDYASALLEEQNMPAEALMAQIKKHNRNLQLCLYSLLDIMIHYENASYNQVAHVLQAFGIDDVDSITAIYTYIVEEPCNYLKYYLGYMEILELQQQARTLLGADYTDYAFHRFLLDRGPSDFSTLTEHLTKYGRTDSHYATPAPK